MISSVFVKGSTEMLQRGITSGRQTMLASRILSTSKTCNNSMMRNSCCSRTQTYQKRFFSKLENNKSISNVKEAKNLSFTQRWLSPKDIPPRGTLKWYGEMTLICTVFAITGTSTMFLVRPAMSEVLGLNGSLKEGPWSYRICSIGEWGLASQPSPSYFCIISLYYLHFH